MKLPRFSLRLSTVSSQALAALCLVMAVALLGCPEDDTAPPLLGDNLGRPTVGAAVRCPETPPAEDNDLVIHVIDVGQGDAIWIETPDDGDDGNGTMEGLDILIDAGRLGFDGDEDTGQVVARYLDTHGLPRGTEIDYLVLTHAHADHYGGAVTVFDAFDVTNVVDPGFDNTLNSTYTTFLNAANTETNELGGSLYRPLVGTLIEERYDEISAFGDELAVVVLNSDRELRLGDSRNDQINNTSIALHMTYAGIEILLMGDVHREGEAEIIAERPALRANILKVGHHGSASSSSPDFLAQIFGNVPANARYAVISSGLQNFGGSQLPAPAVVARLAEYVAPQALFSTEFQDADTGLGESGAPGDDHVVFVVTADGQVSACYSD